MTWRPFDVTVSLDNTGDPSAGSASLALSFPEGQGLTFGAPSGSGWTTGPQRYLPGQTIPRAPSESGGAETTMSARYSLVAAANTACLDRGGRLQFTVPVTSPATSALNLFYRGGLARTASETVLEPTTASAVDQQGYPVNVATVAVGDGTASDL